MLNVTAVNPARASRSASGGKNPQSLNPLNPCTITTAGRASARPAARTSTKMSPRVPGRVRLVSVGVAILRDCGFQQLQRSASSVEPGTDAEGKGPLIIDVSDGK